MTRYAQGSRGSVFSQSLKRVHSDEVKKWGQVGPAPDKSKQLPPQQQSRQEKTKKISEHLNKMKITSRDRRIINKCPIGPQEL